MEDRLNLLKIEDLNFYENGKQPHLKKINDEHFFLNNEEDPIR
jgi:hypothetical protein